MTITELWEDFGNTPTKDKRFTFNKEFCGYPQPRYVVRFCGEFVGSRLTKDAAIDLARDYLMGAGLAEKIENG